MSRPRLRVHCYKKSGKLAYSNIDENSMGVELKRDHYHVIYDYFPTTDRTIESLMEYQKRCARELVYLIKCNDPSVNYLSPEDFGFDREYIYTIELLLSDEQQGFCTFLMDKTK